MFGKENICMSIEIKCSGDKFLKLSELSNFQGELKSLSNENYKKLKTQIENHGFIVPFFVWKSEDKNYILDGHQREAVLSKMANEGVVLPEAFPVVYVEAENEKDAKAKLLAINSQYGKMTEQSLFDFAGMDFDFSELAENFTLPVDMKNLKSFFDEAGKSDSEKLDDVPEERETDIQAGDMFQLGRHRLLCGDSIEPQTFEKLLKTGEIVDCVLTDPPYGINVVKKERIGGGGAFGGIKNLKQTISGNNIIKANEYFPVKGDETTETAEKNYLLLKLNGIKNFIFFGGNYFTDFLPASRGWACWDKIDGLEGTTKNFSDCELIWTSFNCPARIFRHRWQGLLKGSEHNEKRIHPTQKPVKLLVDIMDNYRAGKVILEPFAGSGSTLLACEKTDRSCYAVEYEPLYCQVIIDRWEKLTGKKAERI